jgi:dolichyl-phosphate-mannose-protein mannosyltransferase
MQSWRTQFADGYARDRYRPGLARFQILSFRACFVLLPALVHLATFVPLHGLSFACAPRADAKPL